MDNAEAGRSDAAPARCDGPVVAVLLAAGASRRFGPENKLLADIGGEPLVARVMSALLGSRIAEVVVVAPADAAAIEAALVRPLREQPGRARMVTNPDPSRGIGSSISTGIGAIAPGASGAMIVPGDIPGIQSVICDELIAAFLGASCEPIVHAATSDGSQRNPVIWPRRLFSALQALDGDSGAKALIARERAKSDGQVIAVPFAAPEIFLDVDLPSDLARWRTAIYD